MKITKYIAFAALSSVLFAGCSHTQKVATKKPTDSKMTCEEIAQEFADLESVMRKAKKNKGASGANIAAVVFFWPAAVGNYLDAENAEELVEDRRNNLVALSEKKGC